MTLTALFHSLHTALPITVRRDMQTHTKTHTCTLHNTTPAVSRMSAQLGQF